MTKMEAGNRWYGKLDLKAAFHQIPLDEESQGLSTIATPIGTFKYTVMPFRIKTAPSAFQRIMDKILVGRKATLCYLDDILITAQDKMTLKERVNIVRDKLKESNISINEEKSMDEGESVEWLGY